jgi:hypothetical protein
MIMIDAMSANSSSAWPDSPLRTLLITELFIRDAATSIRSSGAISKSCARYYCSFAGIPSANLA